MKTAFLDSIAANVQTAINEMISAKTSITVAKNMGVSTLEMQNRYSTSKIALQKQIDGLKLEGYTFTNENNL
jgi:hypothetical protein